MINYDKVISVFSFKKKNTDHLSLHYCNLKYSIFSLTSYFFMVYDILIRPLLFHIDYH